VSWTTLTGACAIVLNGGRLLLVRQRRPYGVQWELPGGYYEPGESFEQTAAREVLEETAIAVEVGELACTMLWQREHDRRRNLLAYFLAAPVDTDARPRPQTEEEIEDAAYVDPSDLRPPEFHPLDHGVFARWQNGGGESFHVHVEVAVGADGTQSYEFRS
jgi:8-oxo-dGTP diphosphatase